MSTMSFFSFGRINLVLVEQLEQPLLFGWITPTKTNMATEFPRFEDVFPIENEVVHCHVRFRECTFCLFTFFKTFSKSIGV